MSKEITQDMIERLRAQMSPAFHRIADKLEAAEAMAVALENFMDGHPSQGLIFWLPLAVENYRTAGEEKK